MIRRIARAVAVAMLLVGATGCWSNRPVEFRAMVLMLGIAPAKGGAVRLLFQIPTRHGLTSLTSGGGGANRADDYVVTGTGRTAGMALTEAQSQSQTDIYLGQTQVVALSTKLSPSQFADAEDWLTRLGPFDKTAYIVATPSVSALLHTTPKNGLLPAIDLYDGFSCTDCETVSYQQHQWDVEMARYGPVQTVWMPYVTVASTGFRTDEVALYGQGRPLAILTGRNTQWLGYALGRTGKGYLSERLPQGTVGLRTVRAKPAHTIQYHRGHVTLQVVLHMTATLDEWTGPPVTTSTLRYLQAALAAKFQPQVKDLLLRLQRVGADPFGFGQSFAWQCLPAARRAREWSRLYRRATIHVAVSVHIISVGDSI